MFCVVFMESSDSNLLEQTYATLIGILGEANKNTHIKYQPRIEDWIEAHFKCPKVWRTLTSQLSRLLKWIASDEAANAQNKGSDVALKKRSTQVIRQLHDCMRGVKFLFNIMKRSCEIEIEEASNQQEKDQITHEYNQQISSLFSSMNRMMSLKQPKAVTGIQVRPLNAST